MNQRALHHDVTTSPETAAQVSADGTIRLTAAQAVVRYLAAQRVETEDGTGTEPLFGGVFAIFGHGNVAGLGEALYQYRHELPTYRAHNEQAMAHSAIAFAKAHFRRRMMAVTTSIGPGATNLVTAAALAHVNRLPVLLLPGDVFVSRAPDPVLQQVEDFHADAALCGPVTLAMPQDVQATAYDYPADFFAPRVMKLHAPAPIEHELDEALAILRNAKQPMIVAGGGVLYGHATDALKAFATRYGIPVAETQAGKSALAWDDPLNLGSLGVTGSPGANEIAHDADCVLAVGTRLQDFTTGSNTLFTHAKVIGINANAFDAIKHRGCIVQADARLALEALSSRLESWQADAAWTSHAQQRANEWRDIVHKLTHAPQGVEGKSVLPYDADVIGAVQRSSARSTTDDIVVCAAGTLPAELHKLWRAGRPGAYHVEYGYSCMGYEIAGGLGAKLARPEREVIVMVGDGSYLMMNSEIATSVMLGAKLIVVVLDNRGYGCINRLQQACGGAPFNNMFDDCVQGAPGAPNIDFAAHARAMGAQAEHVANVHELEAAMQRARAADRTYVISIDTDAARTTDEGGWWWEVAVPEVSQREGVRKARADYEAHISARGKDNE